jgi:hypothetical protein
VRICVVRKSATHKASEIIRQRICIEYSGFVSRATNPRNEILASNDMSKVYVREICLPSIWNIHNEIVDSLRIQGQRILIKYPRKIYRSRHHCFVVQVLELH